MSWSIPPGTSLEVLLAEWRGAMVTSVSAETISDTYKPHSGSIAEFFHDKPWGITKSGMVDYARHRLGKVTRSTVQKELSTLRSFLGWCVERELLEAAPPVAELPRRAAGTRAKPQRVNTLLLPTEARGTIAYLPEWAEARRTGAVFPVRARFELAFESALRPATISRLVAGKHYSKGWTELRLTADTLKSRRERVMPLNERARAALDRVCPESGLIFGKHDYRGLLEIAACKAVAAGVLPAEKARTLSPYDLRHSRGTEWAEKSRNLSGIQALLDHTDLKSTMRYVHPTEKAARAVLDEAGGTPTRRGGGLVGVQIMNDVPAVRRRGLEPPRPLRTPEPESGASADLAGRARELITCAGDGTLVGYHVLLDFARDCLRSTEMGRLALGVIDGGPHGYLRALELAQHVAATDAPANAEEAT